ncbi:large ribosomal subunit protein P1-like [Cavia porcellus]|uniref:large ribosomal subunit protein P1-like n=1 Tax=Cavia porcellus TaxID=10141 RepID=UPI002FDFAA95
MTSQVTSSSTCPLGPGCKFMSPVLQDCGVTFVEDEINALIKAAGVNMGLLGPGFFAKSLASAYMEFLICNTKAGGPAPAAGAAPEGGSPSHCSPKRKKQRPGRKNPRTLVMTCFGLFD